VRRGLLAISSRIVGFLYMCVIHSQDTDVPDEFVSLFHSRTDIYCKMCRKLLQNDLSVPNALIINSYILDSY